MFQYTQSTFSSPIIFLGYFLIQNSFYFLCSSYKKKVRAAGSFPSQNQSKLANQMDRNHCGPLLECGEQTQAMWIAFSSMQTCKNTIFWYDQDVCQNKFNWKERTNLKK